MKRLKALLILLGVSICIAGVGLIFQQTRINGRTSISGATDIDSSSPGGGSVGPAGHIQAADGSGGFEDTGCTATPGGVSIACVTFNTAPTVSNGGKTCPIFPDNSFYNVDVHDYPVDQGTDVYTQNAFPNVTQAFTAASWTTGTATVTVGSTAGMTTGTDYPISGAISASCLTGGDCGFNSHVTALGGTGSTYVVTVIDGTHFSYPLTSNPGAWSSAGLIYTSTPVLFHHVPEMYLNFADNTTPTLNPTNSEWTGATQLQSDAGPYPWTNNFLISLYNNTVGGGYVQPFVTTATSYPFFDRHVLSINMDTCMEYETYFLQNNSAPWQNSNGAIWNFKLNDLRTMHKLLWYGNDSTGMTSADVAGLDIWAGTLTYAELFSGSPIHHVIRIGLPASGGGGGGVIWPGTHTGANAVVPLGVRWVLSPTFDTVTCHFRDCAGLAWPDYMVRLLTALQHYGVVFTDTGGGFVGVSSDAVQNWGATDDNSSPTAVLTGYLKGIMWQNGHTIDHTSHVVNVLSGVLN